MYNVLKVFAMLSAVVVLATSCSDDEIYGTVNLSQSAIYLNKAGAQSTLSFTCTNATTLRVSSLPYGWEVKVDYPKRLIYVTAPSDISENSDAVLSGTVALQLVSVDDMTTSASFDVGFAEQVDISQDVSNSIVITKPNLIYSFDSTLTTPGGGAISPSSAKIVWQTQPAPLAYASCDDGKIVFYVNEDVDDDDSDGDKSDIVQGNALIAACDADGDVLWSWHIWLMDNSFGEVTFNGRTIMDLNLGAFTNSNSSDDNILSSYGLYYQWGRKDPFIYPASYTASSSASATMVGTGGNNVEIIFEESDSNVGTVEYATKNPLSFILGVENSSYDWLYSSHNSELWGATKSIYDPCPKGWRVADADTYLGAEIVALQGGSVNLDDYASSYGWELSDGATAELFMGLGRMNYINGYYQNVYPNLDNPYLPWVGNYWTIGSTQDGNSSSLYFTYDASDEANNKVYPQYSTQRANAMQIRCQKE